jgi:hypothetical protein
MPLLRSGATARCHQRARRDLWRGDVRRLGRSPRLG